jgi:hypothetical protein
MTLMMPNGFDELSTHRTFAYNLVCIYHQPHYSPILSMKFSIGVLFSFYHFVLPGIALFLYLSICPFFSQRVIVSVLVLTCCSLSSFRNNVSQPTMMIPISNRFVLRKLSGPTQPLAGISRAQRHDGTSRTTSWRLFRVDRCPTLFRQHRSRDEAWRRLSQILKNIIASNVDATVKL